MFLVSHILGKKRLASLLKTVMPHISVEEKNDSKNKDLGINMPFKGQFCIILL